MSTETVEHLNRVRDLIDALRREFDFEERREQVESNGGILTKNEAASIAAQDTHKPAGSELMKITISRQNYIALEVLRDMMANKAAMAESPGAIPSIGGITFNDVLSKLLWDRFRRIQVLRIPT